MKKVKKNPKKKPVHTTTPTAWSHVSGYSFPEYNSDTDEIDDAYEGEDYDDYDADWFDDYDEQGKIDNIQQEYFTSILLDKCENAWYNNKAVARERELRE